MTPEEALMLSGLLDTSRGSPGYGKSTIQGIAIDDSVLTLTLLEISSQTLYRIRIPFARMTLMDAVTFSGDPRRFGSLLALYLDEEVDTGLLSRKGSTADVVVITLSTDD